MTTKNFNATNSDACAPRVHENAEGVAELPPNANQHRSAAGTWAVSPQVEAEWRQRVDAYRVEIESATGLPATFVGQLREEMALALDGIAHSTEQLAGGLLTVKGKVKAAYRTRLFLAQRVATIAQLLGLEAPADTNKQRPWSKLSRAEQEAQAQAALDALHGGAGQEEA